MNSNKYNFLIVALIAIFAFTPNSIGYGYAQGQRPGYNQQDGRHGPRPGRGNFNPTEFRKKVRAFITKEAKLTQSEANIIFPLFFELKDQQRNLKKKIDNACRRVTKERLSERDCQQILAEVKRMQRQFGELEGKFYDRLRQRKISASTILRLMAADEKFRRTTFHNATNAPKRQRR